MRFAGHSRQDFSGFSSGMRFWWRAGEAGSGFQQFFAASQPALQVASGLFRGVPEHFFSDTAGQFDQCRVGFQIGVTQQRHTGLAAADEFTGAAQVQVLAGDLEAVAVLVNDLQPRPSGR